MLATVAVFLFCFGMLGSVAAAQRLATRAEARALTHGFEQIRAFRHDVVTEVRVSTIDSHWAAIQYVPGPVLKTVRDGTASAAGHSKAKTADVVQSGQSVKTGKPPQKVKSDLAQPLGVYVVFDVKNGSEDGNLTVSGQRSLRHRARGMGATPFARTPR